MNEFLEILSEAWAIRALVTSSIVGITCGIIGCFIVLKNMSLIGDALSHSILPGVYFAFVLVGYSTLGFFVGSVIAGLITAVAITWIQTNVKTKNDAAIGIVFTAMFAIGVIGISSLNNKQGNHIDLKDFLFGNVLGISNHDIVLSAMVLLFTLASIIIFFRNFFLTTFQPVIAETMGVSTKMMHYFLMLMLSFAVVAALQSVGVILVVAMLITPASTALLLSHKLQKVIVYSGVIGLLSAISGMVVSIIYDMPPGPSIVLVATGLYLIAAFFSPEKGLIQAWSKKRAQKLKIFHEDLIKALSKPIHQSKSIKQISELLNSTESAVIKGLSRLKKKGLITEGTILSLSGKQTATDLVRAHRLWESYQVNKMGMKDTQIHPDAERLEHQLTPEQIDRLDERLGYPENDPHGSPIPKKEILPPKPLLALQPREKGTISKKQINDWVESELWELGILPNSSFVVSSILSDGVKIKVKSKDYILPAHLAKMVNVQ
jgi:ABC-type Mn2+/Zn2+ transport system permease subunit/Mn-dependent DtxR family transcriptional regulator